MQAPKNGFFYVLDAATGDLVSGTNFVPVNWAEGLDENGRPIEVEAARYDRTGTPAIVQPGGGGAHSWNPWSYNPQTGLVYFPALLSNFPYVGLDDFVYNPSTTNTGIDTFGGGWLYDEPGAPPRLNGAYLLAWDPVAQKEVWRVDGRGGGTLSTAGGLVFQGNSANREFAAYRATDGEKLWSMPVQTGIVAGPISFELEGVQHVAVAAGSGLSRDYYAPNGSRLLVFKLGGEAELPPLPEFTPAPIDPPRDEQPAELVAAGGRIYGDACAICHGDNALVRGVFPDLRRSATLHAQESFDFIVLEGARQERGMASFADTLTLKDTRAIRAFIIAQAQEALRAPEPADGR
jgi:alcohol dehydrogenase (cytochrome c)/quinohemoprotein ethanol dehydrogenase